MISSSDSSPEVPLSDIKASPVVVVDIGNSSIAVAISADGSVSDRRDFERDDIAGVGASILGRVPIGEGGQLGSVVVASVVPDACRKLVDWVDAKMNIEALVVGEQIKLPIEIKLSQPQKIGVDRICATAAAFDRRGEPCVVVDFGTAVTIDLVDGDGVFAGGAIMPGCELQARALHEHTAQLPLITPEHPKHAPGRDTVEAMQVGIHYGIAGAVRGVVEAYATELGYWPCVIATGGDSASVADSCGIIDVVVPDLCLMGIGLAYRRWLHGAAIL